MKAESCLGYTVLALVFTETTFGQANFLLRNLDGGGSIPVNAPVFDAQGVPLAGPRYLAELWGAVTPDALVPLVALDRGESRLFAPFATGGYFIGTGDGYLSVLTVPPGGYAWLQVRAWDARLGVTYEVAVAAGLGGYGESPCFTRREAIPSISSLYPALSLACNRSICCRKCPSPPCGRCLLLAELVWSGRCGAGDRDEFKPYEQLFTALCDQW